MKEDLMDNEKVEIIKTIVCKHFEITKEQLIEKTNKRNIVKPRQLCMYLCTIYTKLSYGTIGYVLGGKDHATINHAKKSVEADICTYKKYKDTLYYIIDSVNEEISLALELKKETKRKQAEIMLFHNCI